MVGQEREGGWLLADEGRIGVAPPVDLAGRIRSLGGRQSDDAGMERVVDAR
ncbi:MAG TPA: hypothetical protein VG435_01330 [Acidimicrobiales bacterium]|nr:hypothetical protein [Acidimicrobiales bacterium]